MKNKFTGEVNKVLNKATTHKPTSPFKEIKQNRHNFPPLDIKVPNRSMPTAEKCYANSLHKLQADDITNSINPNLLKQIELNEKASKSSNIKFIISIIISAIALLVSIAALLSQLGYFSLT